MKTATCDYCGQSFKRQGRGPRRFCSKRCGNRHNREALGLARFGVRQCQWCGQEFVPYRDAQAHCGKVCANHANALRRRGTSVRKTGKFPEQITLANGVTAKIEVDVVERGGQRQLLPRPVWE